MKTTIFFLLLLVSVVSYSQPITNYSYQKYDIALMDAVDTVFIPLNYRTKSAEIGLQIYYKNVTGVVDGSYSIYLTNDINIPYVLVDVDQFPQVISSSTEMKAYQRSVVPFIWMPIILNKNGMTGGTIEFYYTLN